jgi:alpha-glucosidase
MNEPASFCLFPCKDPEKQAADRGLPPAPPPGRQPPRSIPGFPESGQKSHSSKAVTWQAGSIQHADLGQSREAPERMDTNHDGDNLLHPPYRIHNHAEKGDLGEQTMHPDVRHANGLWAYDTHNIYGARK